MKEFSYHFDSGVLPCDINSMLLFNAKSAPQNYSITGKIILKNEDQIFWQIIRTK